MADDFSPHIVAVATLLWGDPNTRLSRKNEIRWGNKGARSVIPSRGVFRDNEEDVGGGVLDMVERYAGVTSRKDAVGWLRAKGFLSAESERRGFASNGGEDNGHDEAPPWAEDPINKPVVAFDNWHEVAAFDYVNRKGSLAFQVVRLEDGEGNKTYRQRRPDPSKPGGWNWSTKDIERFPYRLPELLAAIEDGATIFIVEGEKCVEAMIDAGYAATTNPAGAGKWGEDLNRYFADADVVVVPDNDPQARKPDGSLLVHADGRPKHTGRDHMAQVAAALFPVARSVRWLDLGGGVRSPEAGPDLPPKGDVVDWFASGKTGDDIATALKTIAKPWTPDFDWRSKFLAIPWHELDEPGEEFEWLIKGWLTERDRSMLVGPSRSGKSFLALHAAMCIALGAEFFGAKVRQGLVVYQAGEGRLGFKKRLRAYRAHHGIPAKERIPFVLLPKRIDLYGSDDHTNQLIDEVEHWKRAYSVPLKLIVIDTYSAATPGSNENASEDVSKVLARCDRLATVLHCHVMVVHHMNAAGTKPRGHTSVFADLDNVIMCVLREGLHDAGEEHADPQTGEKLTPIRRPIREAEVIKQKDGADGVKVRFVLKGVAVGRDADGDDVTSCVVVPPFLGRMADIDTGKELTIKLSMQAQIFLRAVHEALDSFGEPAPGSLALPAGVRVVEWKHIKAAFDRMSFEEEGGDEKDHKRRAESIRKALQRHGETLLAEQVIMRSAPYVWLTGKRVRGIGKGARIVSGEQPTVAPGGKIIDQQGNEISQAEIDASVPGFAPELEEELPF